MFSIEHNGKTIYFDTIDKLMEYRRKFGLSDYNTVTIHRKAKNNLTFERRKKNLVDKEFN